MENGFYKIRKACIDETGEKDVDWEALESEQINCGKALLPFNLNDFLHGYCTEFAACLHNTFGYDMYQIKDENTKALIHAFCMANVNGRRCFIDIRGITDRWDDFIHPFLV